MDTTVHISIHKLEQQFIRTTRPDSRIMSQKRGDRRHPRRIFYLILFWHSTRFNSPITHYPLITIALISAVSQVIQNITYNPIGGITHDPVLSLRVVIHNVFGSQNKYRMIQWCFPINGAFFSLVLLKFLLSKVVFVWVLFGNRSLLFILFSFNFC